MIDLNNVVEYFRLKDRRGMDPKVMEDIEFRERTSSAIWINNPNYDLSEKELNDILDSKIKIKGEEQVIRNLVSSASGLNTLDYYALRSDEPQSTLGLYKINKKRILHFLATGELLPKEGKDLKYFSFENEIPKENPKKEDYIKFLHNIYMKKQIVYIDTETTGLYPDRGDTAIQIYLLRTFQGKKVSDLKLYIKPYKNPIALETQAIHHIDDQVIANEGIYPIEALDKITEFVESNPDTVVFGHNVNFDMRMLQFMYNDWKREMYTFAHIDTIDLVKTILQKYNPAIKKANLSYIITEYMKDVDLEELRDNVVSYTERFHNHEHDKYNGNREQFEKDTLILEKGILKGMNIFLTKEKENELLVDKETNMLQGFYEKFLGGGLVTEQEKVETLNHVVLLLKKKIDRRHQADYDVIQTMSMVNKIITDYYVPEAI